jgi:hypothetical protein
MELLIPAGIFQAIIALWLLISLASSVWVFTKFREMEVLSIIGALYLIWSIPFLGVVILLFIFQNRKKRQVANL